MRAAKRRGLSPARPHMVSVPVSPYCELARWILDRLGVEYTEEAHAPVLHLLSARRYGGRADGVVPVLATGELSLTDAREIVDFYERRAPPQLRLFPSAQGEREEVRRLFDEVFDELGVAVRAWAYAYMLPRRASTVRAWSYEVSGFERTTIQLAYPLLAALVRRNLRLNEHSVPEQRRIIDACVARLAARLDGGGRYLVGDRLSAADVALAALIAPAVLPPEYRGPLPSYDELPEPMQREVDELRAHPVGAFALRLYREERGQPVR